MLAGARSFFFSIVGGVFHVKISCPRYLIFPLFHCFFAIVFNSASTRGSSALPQAGDVEEIARAADGSASCVAEEEGRGQSAGWLGRDGQPGRFAVLWRAAGMERQCSLFRGRAAGTLAVSPVVTAAHHASPGRAADLGICLFVLPILL